MADHKHTLIGHYIEDGGQRSAGSSGGQSSRGNSNSALSSKVSSKRNSCACRKCSLFNFDDCDPKEATTVIKYLRFRKVWSVFWFERFILRGTTFRTFMLKSTKLFILLHAMSCFQKGRCIRYRFAICIRVMCLSISVFVFLSLISV